MDIKLRRGRCIKSPHVSINVVLKLNKSKEVLDIPLSPTITAVEAERKRAAGHRVEPNSRDPHIIRQAVCKRDSVAFNFPLAT